MGLYAFLSAVFLSYVCMHVLLFHSFHGLRLQGNETDRLSLLEIKPRITVDPFGVLASWNETNHFCHWHGVSCGHLHQRVTMLDLQSLKLAGSISPHVGNLSFLRVIHLQNNSFSHQIPPEISHLRRLQDLHLENNSLSGEIPSNLSACSQLITVSLGFNFLVGRIPEELGTLPKLRTIAIYRNNLSGTLPQSFSNLSSLEVLSASTNNLNGSIPDIFGQLTELTVLVLDLNSFSGMLPHSIFNLSSIRLFSVVVNQVQGSLPSNLGVVFPRLEYFDISLNHFDGFMPVSLSNASNLAHLGMSGNQLHGKVPSLENLHRLERLILGINNLGSGGIGDLSFLCDLVNATRLEILQINLNNFGGMLPQCTANLSSSLVSFFVSWNKFFGRIPNGIGNLHNLDKLRLSFNQFSGHIPMDLGKLKNLYELDLAVNLLSGNVPSSFGNLSGLNSLYLSYNNLQGNIPSSLSQCLNLKTVSLGTNKSGIIPRGVIGLSSSYVELYLGDNHFSGFLPEEVGNLINLETLDVSGNMLSGEIPTSLSGCIKLEYLYMHRNLFQGTVPVSLGSLRGIKYLDLSLNNLSGTIPDFLEGFEFLQYLNLSYNNLEGMVPIKGVFMNATATSVKGNSKLCGGIPAFQLPKCNFGHSKKEKIEPNLKIDNLSRLWDSWNHFCFLVFVPFCLRRKRTKQSISSDSENFLKVSYHSLVKATDGFSSANLIGTGSFGSVYKGVLEQYQTTIAVKVLNLVHPGASKSFTAECEALKNIRHRNLLKVLSVCSGTDYCGCDFKALVYEFMVNGSLEEWLHSAQEVNGMTNERQRILKFLQRLNIAIDIAMALDYLHNHCETSIVHCDLKPSNVLLNDDMIGHVGDFGLVRFLHKASDTVSGDKLSSLGVKGTIGYTPPEYGMGHEVWTQGDVYSYGILLLEMFTAKRPTDKLFQGSSNLRNFVEAALHAQELEIVDPVLVQEQMEEQKCTNNSLNDNGTRVSNKFRKCLISILEIGAACSAELPRERLDISDAVAELCRIKNKYLANTICE